MRRAKTYVLGPEDPAPWSKIKPCTGHDAIDQVIGRLCAALHERYYYDDTIVICACPADEKHTIKIRYKGYDRCFDINCEHHSFIELMRAIVTRVNGEKR